MTIQIELSPEAEAQLAAEAVLRGVAIEKYASDLLQKALNANPIMGTGVLTTDGLDAMTSVLTRHSQKMPILNLEANERASYYEDR